jgi:surfactin synthase thioesterase subunit
MNIPLSTFKKVFFLCSHASGTAYHYVDAFQSLNEMVRLVPLELPGHGKRRGEKLLDSLWDIALDLSSLAIESFMEDTNLPYYVFGHSMGALNAYLTTQVLIERGFTNLRHFFVSSYSIPGWHPIPPGMTEMPDEDMWWESAKRFGVLNNQPIPTPEQMELYSNVYRTDLKAVYNFKPKGKSYLPAPISVFYAENDMVDLKLVEPWKDYSHFSVEIIKVPGGHFHPLENPQTIESIIIQRL